MPSALELRRNIGRPNCHAWPTDRPPSFQDLILRLQRYWAEQGCVILQPYDIEVGAGTFHPATTLRALGPEPWNAAYVQPSRRPTDGRYGENPNRLQHYYQFQVILKPSPPDLQELYLQSLYALGIDPGLHDIRFVEDDWESPTLGAWGLGWEVWCDGMEVTQFTYFQQVGGIDCRPVSGELTYGLERLAMYVQGVENVYDLDFNGQGVTYGEVFLQAEQEYSAYNFEVADTELLFRHFADAESRMPALILDARPGAAGLRPVPEGQPPVQPAGCPRRDQRHRAGGLHRPGARAGQGLRRGLARRRAASSADGLADGGVAARAVLRGDPARMQDRARRGSGAAGRRAAGRRPASPSTRPIRSYATPRRLTVVRDRACRAAGRPRGRAQGPARRRAGAGARGLPARPCRARAHARGARRQEGQGARSRSSASPAGRWPSLLAELLPQAIRRASLAEVDALGRRRLPLGPAAAVASCACSTARSCRSSSGGVRSRRHDARPPLPGARAVRGARLRRLSSTSCATPG